MPETEAKVNEAVLVDIGAIDGNLRPASQMRVELNREALERYAEKLDEMPAVELMYDDNSHTYWVIDGAHTITSAALAMRAEILAVVTDGTFLDAWMRASRANKKHGVPLSEGDKKHRVLEMVHMPIATTERWSQQKIADLCDVSRSYVTQLDDREFCHSDINGNPGKMNKPGVRGRPVGSRKPKAETKGDPEPSSEPESNGHATTTAAPEVSSEQTEAEANEKAAEQWGNHVLNALNILSSLERRGGVKALTEKWSKKRREQFAGQFRALVEQYQMIISQIEETL